jgi:hypothetical protein
LHSTCGLPQEGDSLGGQGFPLPCLKE